DEAAVSDHIHRTDDDCTTAIACSHQVYEPVAVWDAVRIAEHDERTARQLDTAVAGAVGEQPMRRLLERRLWHSFADDFRRPLLGRAVDHDRLEIAKRLRAKAVEEVANRCVGVVRGQNDRNAWRR